ncbi:MAG: malto-oligosyltrehalose synthase [Syntrophales bacterium]|jgi:(1->4)-alpha-D-glucan 1-alpha-D-glucosylmutase|nr:malto-oligosyltrehalose synthase [Syntrophales bacterium]MDY0044057.1 malto-oligosyltrehalose synthase [Syntrophales bacterium]
MKKNETPSATYRMQFHRGFTLEAGAALAGYLKQLGISHVYASPVFKAAAGSLHGYDVVDPGFVNPELGGEKGFDTLVGALKKEGLGLVIDIVPNHMEVGNGENPWWNDVLENGSLSRFDKYFDIDWIANEERLKGKILLPVLADHYGRILEAGKITLRREKSRFFFYYEGLKFPLSPESASYILNDAAIRMHLKPLSLLASIFRQLVYSAADCPDPVADYYNRKAAAEFFLEDILQTSHESQGVLDEVIEEIGRDHTRIDFLMNLQHYRLSWWKAASRNLNYRRFFDISSLAAIRCESREVFETSHALILDWLKRGTVSGLRIDHPDGLRDPAQYFNRLQEVAPEVWKVAEKILVPGEKLPARWPVDGTTGYDFMNLLTGLFIDPEKESPLTEFYIEFTGETRDYHSVERASKHQVMRDLFTSEIYRLSRKLADLLEEHLSYRDFTIEDADKAIREIIACFPVYRTYMEIEGEEARKEDRKVIGHAIMEAKQNQTGVDQGLLDFIGNLFSCPSGSPEREFILAFQQVTGAITAKGVEDTAFYTYNRFLALNEVGGDPAQFGIPPEEFHRVMAETCKERPKTMVATSTHDSKRSEDVRARLVLLSEIPELWIRAVRRFSEMNEKYRKKGMPDRNMEYFIYQALTGAWPIDEERLFLYLQKAAREAKTHTSWLKHESEYEERLRDFIHDLYGNEPFKKELRKFVEPLVGPGHVNSLSQVLLKATIPGIPDFYQGTELWDLSLVDPDNRRPVDFEKRRFLLQEVQSLSAAEIMKKEETGLPKFYVMKKALDVRRENKDLFELSGYTALESEGERKKHVIGFLRGGTIAAVVPRLILNLNGAWGSTCIFLPEGKWNNIFTGEVLQGGAIPASVLFESFPVSLLLKEG